MRRDVVADGSSGRVKVLVTGAGGFVGTAVSEALVAAGIEVRAGTRTPERHAATDGVRWVRTPELGQGVDWSQALEGADAVIHLAARAHVRRDVSAAAEREFQRVNAEGTRSLALAAEKAGVGRFVFLSSIGVNGTTTGQRPFTEDSPPDPRSFYARSKLEAEQALREASLDIVVVRSPLVYGPRASGNFGRLLRAVTSEWPIPLGRVHNRRSFVGVRNLGSFLARAVMAPDARGKLFLISDGEDLSTPDLIRRLAQAAGVRARLIPVPVMPMRVVATALGRRDLFEQLCDSLVIDSARARSELGWRPPVSLDDELRRSVRETPRA
jgi:nucleoside-diphosphate-sugar epimerase